MYINNWISFFLITTPVPCLVVVWLTPRLGLETTSTNYTTNFTNYSPLKAGGLPIPYATVTGAAKGIPSD